MSDLYGNILGAFWFGMGDFWWRLKGNFRPG